ncbi:hypothetical protein ABBQ38_007903 [Trebouxia sp. C0009 RCD-2024]
MQTTAAYFNTNLADRANNHNSLPEQPSTPQHKDAAHSDKVVQDCTGYGRYGHAKSWRIMRWLYGSMLWLLYITSSQWAVHLLTRCPLQHASFVLVKRGDRSSSGASSLHVFQLYLRQYAYCHEHDRFEAVSPVPAQLPALLLQALATLQAINKGESWHTFNQGHTRNRQNMVQLYGNKKWLFQRSQVFGAAVRHALPAVFGIQTLELYYSCYRKFYPHFVILSVISYMGLVGVVMALNDQHTKLVGLVNQRTMVPIVDRGWVRAAPSHRLVPGDVIVLQRGRAPCDVVLLRGSCLVEESMLSGEAVQVRKCNYVPDPGKDYDPDSYTECTVFAGTVVRQVWNAEDPEDEVLAMVVRVKLDTTMGSMIKELIAPVAAVKEKEPFQADVLRLYAFSVCLQLLLLIPYLAKARQFEQSSKAAVHKALDLLVHAASPAIPALMLLCGFTISFRLKRQGIRLLFMEVIKLAADTEVVCFDKTGTLTGSVAEFHGMLPVAEGVFQPLQQNAMRWSNWLKQAMAVCHGLTFINKSTAVGEGFEQGLFKAVEARFQAGKLY